MYAVFSTGGKQYRASTGDIIKVEKIEAEKGATIELDNVLMVGEGDAVTVGTPYVEGGKVTARVVEHGRGDKVKIVKFKRRKHHMKTQGHRQYFTALEITGIDSSKAKPKAEAKEAGQPAEKKTAAKKTAGKKATAKKTASKKAAAKKAAAKKTTVKKAAVKKTAAKAAEGKGEE